MCPTIRLALLAAGTLLVIPGGAEDWPTYQHDNQRSGRTAEQLEARLERLWQHTPRHRPRPAAPEAAPTDYWHKLTDLAPRVAYDRAFHVAVAGEAVYFGSSADDQVHCLDAATGAPRWSVFTGGPVRLAPTVAGGRVYAGSDDGAVWCWAAGDGALLWRSPSPLGDRQVIGNGRLISAFPVRSSVLVEDEFAYACTGLFPNEGVGLRALHARDGTSAWQQTLDLSPQGYLLSSSNRLYTPVGRASPVAFARADGKPAGTFKALGGTEVFLSDGLLGVGPGNTGQIELFRADTREWVAKFNAHHLVATPRTFYLLGQGQLRALDRHRYLEGLRREGELTSRQKTIEKSLEALRKTPDAAKTAALQSELAENQRLLAGIPKQLQDCALWTRSCSHRQALILAGETLYVGGENQVAAFAAADGHPGWSDQVTGQALGLAAANGRLFVSTDQGTIHCFGPARLAHHNPTSISPAADRPTDWPTAALQAARALLAESGARKGFCLVPGGANTALAAALARESELTIVVLEPEAAKLPALRAALDQAGLYGPRVSVQSGPPSALPAGCANLIVLPQASASEALGADWARLLRPYGGVACLGPSARLIRRGPLAQGGAWTHLYADPGNSACSGDSSPPGPTRVQWFGDPGPRLMSDRHHRAVPPLCQNGRLFVPAYNRILALDAYNGTRLWEVEVPETTRLGASKDSGYLALAEDLLYVATPDACLAVDVTNGTLARRFALPQLGPGGGWGYTATVGDWLVGSGRKKTASLRQMGLSVIEIQYGDLQPISTSDSLFCLDRHTGRQRWTYQAGVILDPAIALGDGRVYFLETTNPAVASNTLGRLTLNRLLSRDVRLVALEADTGRVAWKQPADLSAVQHVVFLSHADQTLLVLGSKNKQGSVWYDLFAFDAATGQPLWHREQNNARPTGGDHGEQTLHPALVGGVVYAEPYAYHLRTGEPVADWKFNRNGHGCGTISASAAQLFYRAGHPARFDLQTRQAEKLSVVNRPGCWINIIPAGGLILVPEASSGCTCGFPIETSIAFAPREGFGVGP